MPPTPVEVAEVHPQTVRDQFRALGTLEAAEIIQVVGELNAIIRSIQFTEGRAVQAGDLLVQLDDREIRAEAERSEAQREQAQLNYDRAKKLSEQNVASPQDLDNARTALKVAQANEALAKARLDKTRILAPWPGLIGRRSVSPGAYLKSGDPIAELARVDLMKVAFAAPERYLGQLVPGIAVELTTPAFPGESFHGEVTVVDPIIDPNTRTVQMVARIGNTGFKLRPGMSANVSVTFAQRAMALVVPDEAVFAEGANNFVYVVKPDSTVTRSVITLGSRDSAHVEVVKGLDAGALVVRAGHQKLYEGAHVMPVQSQPAVPNGGGGTAAVGASSPK